MEERVSLKFIDLLGGGLVGFIVETATVVFGVLGDASFGTMGQFPGLKLKSSIAISPW